MEQEKKGIDRAGCIPYYINTKTGKITMLFMLPSRPKYGGESYQIAKGKTEEGETPLETAIREGGEELGLFPANIIKKHHLGKFLGRTDFYVVQIKDQNLFGDPTTPDEVKSTKWMTPEEFQKDGRGIHKTVVKAAVRWIKKQEGIE